jgi:hypothetical protein
MNLLMALFGETHLFTFTSPASCPIELAPKAVQNVFPIVSSYKCYVVPERKLGFIVKIKPPALGPTPRRGRRKF